MKNKEFKVSFGHPRYPLHISIGYGEYPDNFHYILTTAVFEISQEDALLKGAAKNLGGDIEDLVNLLLSKEDFIAYLEKRNGALNLLRSCEECRKILDGEKDPVSFPWTVEENVYCCLNCFNRIKDCKYEVD